MRTEIIKLFVFINYHLLVRILITLRKKIRELCKRFCKQINIKVVFSPFKICDLLSAKDSLPNALKSYVVYKFTCAGCQSCYVGETKRYLPTRMKEDLDTDSKSHIFQHLKDNPSCRDVCDTSCFKIIDHTSSSFRLKLKEALHIQWLKPLLNKQQKHVSITISVKHYITYLFIYLFISHFSFLLKVLIICH